MKELLYIGLLLTLAGPIQAQNIGINVDGATPNASALLDVDVSALPVGSKRGVLLPRVALAAANLTTPVTAPAVSLLVYNTATAGTAPNNVVPGYYYWSGSSWVALGGSAGWSLTGNSGTNPVTNFLGTIDMQDLVFRTTNAERMRILGANGRVGIGISPSLAQLEVSSGTGDAVSGHSNSVGGYLGRETNITFGNPVQTLLGAGVYASNPAAGYTSMFSQSTGAANVAAQVNYSNVWIGNYNYVEYAGLGGPGTPPAVYGQVNVSNAANATLQIGINGYSNRATLAGNPGFTIGTSGTGLAQNQDVWGVYGAGFSNSVLERAGGYFESDTYTPPAGFNYAWVGATVLGVARKIQGSGSVAEIIPTAEHGRISLVCPESPEYWYEDYGTATLVDGHAHVELDPILADIIMVNEEHPIRVYCTPVDLPEFNGVTVTNRTAHSFDLVELNGGTHSGTIDYHLVAKPKTNYGEGRFVQAPGPGWLKPEFEPAAARAANQPDPTRLFHWPADWEVYGYDVEKATPVGSRVHAGPHKGKIKVAEGVFRDDLPADKSAAKR